ncbi:PQQ-dependent sugar dehydrogenase [Clostridium sp. BJN0001]|uniref:PQQ-dependent sugar dehydrogenase n=1 Tax=Clostridium sp. BJN0001 TaxID=2930219 RepID=UPI001FD244D9|nr:PQQ-dependent sugar dehydrogenase [Clostridium sp. BJN0001]
MKGFIKWTIITVIVVILSFLMIKISFKYKTDLLSDDIRIRIEMKNCIKAESFCRDENNNFYISYDDKIKVYNKDRGEKTIYTGNTNQISDIEYYDNCIYFIDGDALYKYDLNKNDKKEILTGIPEEGRYLDRKLKINDNKIFLTIGAVTNSGIAEKSEEYDDNRIPYDKMPFKAALSGENYGDVKTGAFMPYGNSSIKGQEVEPYEIANASIYSINLNDNKKELYSYGIRNVKGIDFNSSGEIVCAVEGMNNEGYRPVNNDSDYIYIVKKGIWYGWPDFSGGNPIDSDRFREKEGKNIKKVILNQPQNIVPSPYYEYYNLSSISSLAVDREGFIGSKDSCIFCDTQEKMIKCLNNDLSILNLVRLNNKSDIKKIISDDSAIYVLDSGNGYIFKIEGNYMKNYLKIPSLIIVGTLFIVVLIIMLINNKNKKIENNLKKYM